MNTLLAFLIVLLTAGLTGYYFYKNKTAAESAVPVTMYNVRTGATYTTYAGDVGNPEIHTPLAPGGAKRHRATPERFRPRDAPMPSKVPNTKLRTVSTQSPATFKWWYTQPRFEALM